MNKVVVLQSNYVPWKGYFDLINDADLFVFYDDLQYTKNDWRNRNKIKTEQGLQWLTIPVGTDSERLICDVQLLDPRWQRKHWEAIRQHYGKCRGFTQYRAFFEEVYIGRVWENLSQLNQYLIKYISHHILGVTTVFTDSRQYPIEGRKLDRLLNLVSKAGATHYISGPSARNYIEPDRFRQLGVELIWKDYSGYPEYEQKHPPFEHGVSILDLLFHVGSDAPWYIWGWRGAQSRSASKA